MSSEVPCSSCGTMFNASSEERLLAAISGMGLHCKRCNELYGYGLEKCEKCGDKIEVGKDVRVNGKLYHSSCAYEAYQR